MCLLLSSLFVNISKAVTFCLELNDASAYTLCPLLMFNCLTSRPESRWTPIYTASSRTRRHRTDDEFRSHLCIELTFDANYARDHLQSADRITQIGLFLESFFLSRVLLAQSNNRRVVGCCFSAVSRWKDCIRFQPSPKAESEYIIYIYIFFYIQIYANVPYTLHIVHRISNLFIYNFTYKTGWYMAEKWIQRYNWWAAKADSTYWFPDDKKWNTIQRAKHVLR